MKFRRTCIVVLMLINAALWIIVSMMTGSPYAGVSLVASVLTCIVLLCYDNVDVVNHGLSLIRRLCIVGSVVCTQFASDSIEWKFLCVGIAVGSLISIFYDELCRLHTYIKRNGLIV